MEWINIRDIIYRPSYIYIRVRVNLLQYVYHICKAFEEVHKIMVKTDLGHKKATIMFHISWSTVRSLLLVWVMVASKLGIIIKFKLYGCFPQRYFPSIQTPPFKPFLNFTSSFFNELADEKMTYPIVCKSSCTRLNTPIFAPIL